MMPPGTVRACFGELEKLADIHFRAKGKENSPLIAAGVFVGKKGGAAEFQKHLTKHKSLQKARASYQKANPKTFITLAFNSAPPPETKKKKTKWWRRSKKDPHFKAKMALYKDQVRSPRVFLREGEPASYAQSALYSEVSRGLYDSELNKPWLTDKQKAFYA